MRTLVTGAGGMLAQALVPTLQGRGHDVTALDRSALDVTDPDAVEAALETHRPEVVIQCAAFTAVDAAEADEASAFRVNADATKIVAQGCQRIGGRFVYLSTDYVFPGTADRPYRPEDPTAPVNAYGRSKLAGERAALETAGALVVRTSWLYGAGGPNFVDSMTRLARERPALQVVNDQTGRPTWTVSLSRAICGLVEAGSSGVFHVTDAGPPVTWFHFAEKVLSLQDLFVPIEPLTTESLARPAARPAYSVLDCSGTEAVLQCSLPLWPDMLGEYLGRRAG